MPTQLRQNRTKSCRKSLLWVEHENKGEKNNNSSDPILWLGSKTKQWVGGTMQKERWMSERMYVMEWTKTNEEKQ